MRTKVLLSVVLLLVCAPSLLAQAIQVRTVPVIAGNQSEFQPSLARGIGGLSVAFVDPLGDPFINPAKAYRLRGVNIFSSPTRNSWSNEDGRPVITSLGSSKYPSASISSVPFGGFYSSGTFFGGGLMAYQGYSAERSLPIAQPGLVVQIPQGVMKRDLGNNTYLFGLFGARLPESRVTLGASVSWGHFGAMDGVNLLYPGSYDIRQDGSALEYKLGVLGELSELDEIEFVAAKTQLRATHEVTFPNLFIMGAQSPYRTEMNRDESNGWILHAGYTRLLGKGWRMGGIVTVNWKDYPKIPNYSLANIPRDPGTTIAYNLGFGMVQETPRTTWGFEYIYEPITSNTWAEAGEAQTNPVSPPLPANFKTIENFFDFHNHIVRVGVQSKTGLDWLDYRLGAQLHFHSYELNQIDNLNRMSRNDNQDWLETTLAGGLNVRFSNFQLIYTVQLILGNGMVGVITSGGWVMGTPTGGGGAIGGGGGIIGVTTESRALDFLVAPSGKLLVDKIPLLTQQITFIFKLE